MSQNLLIRAYGARIARWVAVLLLMTLTITAYAGHANAASVARDGAAVVKTTTGPDGTYLTDGSGRTLYLFAADTTAKSTCNGACAHYWPPFTTTGPPNAGAGAMASLISTSPRDDGSTQVVYNGHPLYYYISDTGPGQTTGQGLNQSGGLWWLVDPAGAAIGPSPSATPSSGAPSPAVPSPSPSSSGK